VNGSKHKLHFSKMQLYSFFGEDNPKKIVKKEEKKNN